MTAPPLVSAVIPCYNAAPWIAAAIASVRAQNWPHCEIIVVNDGSTDASLPAARACAGPDLTVLDQPNRGASAARNAGLRAVRGEFIQFLDADDLLHPAKIATQVHALASTSQALASGEWARFRQEPTEAHFIAESNWRDLNPIEFLQLAFEEGRMMHPAAWLAPRRLLEAAGPWDETLSLNDDGEYFARVMLRASGIRFCAGARSYYRSHLRQSLSGRKDASSLASLYRSFECTLGYLAAADDSPRTRAAIAHGWKWLAFELYPGRPDLAAVAERRSRALGGSRRPLPASGRYQLAARFLGWRLAKRLVG